MKERFSKQRLKSGLKKISLKRQTELAKQTLKALPAVMRTSGMTFKAAPYLLGIYLIIAIIDIQHRIFGPVEPARAFYSIIISFALITAANALCYVESYNTHTNTDRIPNPGWYVTRRYLRMTAVMISSSLIILFGIFLFVIPGLYFAMKLSLALPACMVDDLGVRESLKASIRATSGQLTLIYTTFGLIGLLALPLIMLGLAVDGVLLTLVIITAFSVLPVLIHITLGTLYLNGHSETNIDFLQ